MHGQFSARLLNEAINCVGLPIYNLERGQASALMIDVYVYRAVRYTNQ